jgi:hypothetical protein
MPMDEEKVRLKDPAWKKWGPYVSDRQWGTVREDYSENGDAWNYSTHDMARSKAYRWGEEGIAGISDDKQLLCLSLALWNRNDSIVKEILFGLANKEGNHGEDVKELYYYLDSTPTHSYMKMLYKYPQSSFPYDKIREENALLTREDPEYELLDTGVFDEDAYFDVFVEYAKAGPEDMLVRITAHNRGQEGATLDLLPTLWFRNTWVWDGRAWRPELAHQEDRDMISISHGGLGMKALYFEPGAEPLFCGNETNPYRLFGNDTEEKYYKDGINEYLVHGLPSINPERFGTKAAVRHSVFIPSGESRSIRLRLSSDAGLEDPFGDFDATFEVRLAEANDFYAGIQAKITCPDQRLVQRQAFGGILWNKQFYYYNVQEWLKGDPAKPAPPRARYNGRNHDWKHLYNDDIVSMPDKWEYPWYANWDLAFQAVTLALIDEDFAKHQLELLTKDWYMHPNGKIPAFEWSFNDANPPVYVWATWEVYSIGKEANGGKGDLGFLESMFQKLLINFTWWVNRKDTRGHNIFEGGFLGLDNIGVFDRSMVLTDGILEQADATSWMALFALSMMRISIELAYGNKRYLDMTSKFFSHFVYIAGVITAISDGVSSLWDNEDRFFYDQVRRSDMTAIRLKVRSMVGLTPLFAVEILDAGVLEKEPEFRNYVRWFLENRPDLLELVTKWSEVGKDGRHLLALVNGKRLKNILSRMLDETEFLSSAGIRSVSKYHLENPYTFPTPEKILSIQYEPGESSLDMYGGNSNWRGPIWMPMNYMLVRSLKRFHDYYGDRLKVRVPTGTGPYANLKEVSDELSQRLMNIFLRDANGNRRVFGSNARLQADPHFRDYIPFYEYFHGETGEGLGAGHQTGWTALVANLIHLQAK